MFQGEKRAANKVPKMKCSSRDSAKWDGSTTQPLNHPTNQPTHNIFEYPMCSYEVIFKLFFHYYKIIAVSCGELLML